MRATEASKKLDELYSELESVRGMSESEVCSKYNYSEDDGMDYINLQLSQGLPVIRW